MVYSKHSRKRAGLRDGTDLFGLPRSRVQLC
jgi:hypothetical protein